MIPIGLILMSIQPIVMMFGAFYNDFNETHVYNPTWPGHARFHNGQTISMAIYLGVACIFYTWRSATQPTATAKRESLLAAAIIGSCYCVTGMSAEFYPGALCVDKMFWKESGVSPGCPQRFFAIPLLLNWIGWWVARYQAGPENRPTKIIHQKKI